MRKLIFVIAILMSVMGPLAYADVISFDLSTIANDGTLGPLHGGTVAPAYLVTVTVTTDVANGSLAGTGITVACPNSSPTCFEVEFKPAAGSTLTYVPDPVYINVNGAFAVRGNDGIPSGPGTFDSFGTMSVGSGASKLPQVDFWLIPINGNSWASAADVLTPTTNYSHTYYSQGFMAVDGFFKTPIDQDGSGPNPASIDAEQAGFYTPSAVPEPTSVMLMGTVLLFAGRMLRRKKA